MKQLAIMVGLIAIMLAVAFLCLWLMDSPEEEAQRIYYRSDPNSPNLFTMYHSVSPTFWQIEVPPDEIEACRVWAFGEGPYQQRDVPSRWNKRHPDLFVMYASDSVKASLIAVGRAYMEEKELKGKD